MKKPSLFIYEEDPAILKTLCLALTPFYTISSNDPINNFKSAFELSSSDILFDCILIDSLHLQTFDEDLLKYLKKISNTIPIAILLTIQDTNAILNIVNKGFNHFISNPFSIKTLKREIIATIKAFEISNLEEQRRVSSSIQFRQFRHDLFNIITVAHGYIEFLITRLSDTTHIMYCEKINKSLNRLVHSIKKGFLTTEINNDTNKATVSKSQTSFQ